MAKYNLYDKLQGKPFKLIDNYIYIYNLNKFFILPTYPNSINDSMSASFNSQTPLARSAPIFAYSNSGPRSVQINLTLHRDLMNSINTNVSNIKLPELKNADYVDMLVNHLQALALPKYNSSKRLVDPPMVAIRFGDDIFIKGIVDGGVSVTKSGPILTDSINNRGKYAIIDIGFTIKEVIPYDASEVAQKGSFRGISRTLERKYLIS